MKITFIVMLLMAVWGRQCNITSANYLSPKSLGRQNEMAYALANICKRIRINDTIYASDSTNYSIYNITTKCIYNSGKQQAGISYPEYITVYGGFVEFQLLFNFSMSRIGPYMMGYASASAISSPLNFTKELVFGKDAQLLWVLANVSLLEIAQPIKISRISPLPTDNDLLALNQALSTATTNIFPSNVKQQIANLFNLYYIVQLNRTLQERVMSSKIVYEFLHPYKQLLKVNVTNELYSFNITPSNGFQILYRSLPQGWNNTDCTIDAPENHEDFSSFGGIQTLISLDFFREMATKNIRSGWFNSILNREWNTDAFQFFVGDLYDIIPQTRKLPPQTPLLGSCTIPEDFPVGLKRYRDTIFQLNLDFNCNLQTSDGIRVSEFDVFTNFRVKIIPEYETLQLIINEVIGLSTFKSVGSYVVTNLELADFKLQMALRLLAGYRVFGSGYPVWPRPLPYVLIKEHYVLVYEGSSVHKQKSIID